MDDLGVPPFQEASVWELDHGRPESVEEQVTQV